MARLIVAPQEPSSGQFMPGHGMGKTPEYRAWGNAIHRCENSNSVQWPLYGERGIRVCDRWRFSFEAFLSDIGRRPSSQHSLERIDVNGNYEPGNCRWATAVEQANNRRNTPLVCGMSPREISEKTGLSYNAVKNRIRRGWSEEKIMTQPIRDYRRMCNVDR